MEAMGARLIAAAVLLSAACSYEIGGIRHYSPTPQPAHSGGDTNGTPVLRVFERARDGTFVDAARAVAE
jgi:hypothetical protein